MGFVHSKRFIIRGEGKRDTHNDIPLHRGSSMRTLYWQTDEGNGRGNKEQEERGRDEDENLPAMYPLRRPLVFPVGCSRSCSDNGPSLLIYARLQVAHLCTVHLRPSPSRGCLSPGGRVVAGKRVRQSCIAAHATASALLRLAVDLDAANNRNAHMDPPVCPEMLKLVALLFGSVFQDSPRDAQSEIIWVSPTCSHR